MQIGNSSGGYDRSNGLTATSNKIINGYTALVNGVVVVGTYVPVTSETLNGSVILNITATDSSVHYNVTPSLPTPTHSWTSANCSWNVTGGTLDTLLASVSGSLLTPGSTTNVLTIKFKQRTFDTYEIWTIGLAANGLSLVATKQQAGSAVSGDQNDSVTLSLTFVGSYS